MTYSFAYYCRVLVRIGSLHMRSRHVLADEKAMAYFEEMHYVRAALGYSAI